MVTALVGGKGGGKLSLVKGVGGIYPFDHGQILFEGKEVTIHSPKESAHLGIEIVYQDLALCDNLDSVQNMFLGREIRNWLRLLDETPMEIAAGQTLRDLNVTTLKPLRTPVASLSGGHRQSVALAKAGLAKSKPALLDQPT